MEPWAPSSSATGVQPPAVPPAVPPGVVAVTPTPESQTIDLRGLTAPEPMSQLSRVASTSPVGVSVTVLADDPAFLTDVMTWALATKVEVLSINRQGQTTVASLRFAANSDATTAQASNVVLAAVPANQQTRSTDAGGAELAVCGTHSALSGATHEEQNIAPRENLCSILIIKNDFESLMAALMVATTSAAQGMEVNVFFSFWGVNLLRGERPRRDVAKQKVSVLQKMMQWMMPRGPQRQKMSKMHMGGMGKGMMQYFMKKNNVLTLEELMAVAVEQNVQFTICSMSMGIMGIQKRDIVDFPNVQFAGVTSFVETSRRASMSLVF